MNSKLLRPAGFLAAGIFMLASCSDIAKMQIPDTVSVKTNATYSANFGSYSKSLSDYISASTITEQIAKSNSSFSVYDYNPGSSADCQEFLIKYPVINKTIDVGSSISDIDLTSAGSSAAISQTFSIPDLSKTFTQSVTFSDLNSQIVSQTTIATTPVSVVDPGSTQTVDSASVPDVNIDINSPSFSTITYRAGSLVVNVTAPSGTTLTDLTLTAVLKNRTTGATISTSAPSNVAAGGTLTIPLSGKTLVPALKISFSGSITGTSLGNIMSYTIAPSVSGADISQVTGLTMTSAELGTSSSKSINTSVDLSSTAPLTSAVIGTGSLTVQCPLPSGWSGVTATPDLALSGALTSSAFTNTGGSAYLMNESLDLAGLTFTPGTLSVTGTITLSLNNATIVFPSGGISITTTSSCAISKLSSATIDTSSYTLSQTYSSAVPETLSSFVNSITYSKAGVKVGSYTNTLPAGNDITLTLTSSFLSITGSEAQGTVSSNTTSGTLELAKTTAGTITVSGATSVDTTVAITLPGASGSTAKFSNLATNTTYTLAASAFTPELEWTSINVNTSALAVSETSGVDTGIDFDSIMSSLPTAVQTAFDKNHIQMDSLPVYLSVEMPKLDALSSLSLSGNIYLQYTVDSTTTNFNILGDKGASTAGTLTPKNISLTTSNDVVTTNLATSGLTELNLADVFNARPAGIKLFYNISPSNGSAGVDISYADYEAIKSSGVNIAAIVYIVLPLKATIIQKTSLDIMSLAGKSSTDDLLSRSEALSTTDYQKYLDAIKSITLGVTVGNTMGLSDATIKVTDSDGIFGSAGMTFDLSGNSTITLTGTQITSVLQTYPYMPTVTLTIPKDTQIVIPRSAVLSAGLSSKITTDGTIKLYGGNN
jgi:hypothetical protein